LLEGVRNGIITKAFLPKEKFMFKKIKKMFGLGENAALAPLEKIADEIIALENEYRQLSDEDLANKTKEFKQRLKAGETLDDILVKLLRLCAKLRTGYSA
jgi:preprotein translocase subunit SecA